MAIVSFAICETTSLSDLREMATKSQLDKQGWEEVVESFSAIQVWRSWLGDRYGELKELRHRSNPDDPPDIDLVFEKGQLGLEHTALEPPPLGHAEAIAKEINPGGGRAIPSIARQWARPELESMAFWQNGSDSFMSDDYSAALESLVSSIRKKLKDQLSRIICVIDKASVGIMESEWLASQLWHQMNTADFELLGDRVVILHHRCTDTHFFSALVCRDEPLQACLDGKPVALPTA